MGNLVTVLNHGRDGFACNIDFESRIDINTDATVSSTMSPAEIALHEDCVTWCATAAIAIKAAQDYNGCSDVIRMSMCSPSDMTVQTTAFEALLPNVAQLAEYHDLAQSLVKLVPRVVIMLAQYSLSQKPLIVRTLVEMLAKTLELDQCKMMRPQMQNDFAYYRYETHTSTLVLVYKASPFMHGVLL
jgi:CYRIA/CYRIB Rac1 binding domain